MRSPCCLYVFIPFPERLKAWIVEPEETVVARQQLGKIFPAETNTQVIIEVPLDAMISVQSVSYQILDIQWKESRRLVIFLVTLYI
jgi:hypothetical protein